MSEKLDITITKNEPIPFSGMYTGRYKFCGIGKVIRIPDLNELRDNIEFYTNSIKKIDSEYEELKIKYSVESINEMRKEFEQKIKNNIEAIKKYENN